MLALANPTHTPLEECENATIISYFGFVLRVSRSGKPHDYCNINVFEKPRFQKVLRAHESRKAGVSNSAGLKGVFENLRFRDRFMCTGRY